MTIESLGMRRPAAEPARGRHVGRSERRGATVPPPARSFDAAEVRGSKPPVRQGTEEMLSKLHERGLLTNVSRPLGPDGQPIQPDSRSRAYGEVDTAQAEMAEIPVHDRERIHEAVLKFGAQGFGHTGRPKESTEGRVYSRPRPQPPQAPGTARQNSDVFTIKLYSPREDTGRTLRIGSHVIPLEADGSILAGMPDGTVRRITFDQDVMDEMVARGEVWMEGDEPAGARKAGIGPMEGPPPTDAQEQYAGVARQIFDRQAKEAVEAGVWDAPNGRKADQPRPFMAKNNISSRSGMWGANRIADRMLSYARQVTGDDPTQVEDLKAAMKHGIADVERAWGGEMPDVTRETYDAVVKALDAWAADASKKSAAQEPEHVEAVTFKTSANDTQAEVKQAAEKPSNQSSSDAIRGKGNPALVAQLKADLERRQAQMLDMVREMLGKQGKAVSRGGIWRTLASGNFQVDAKTRAEAQKNIAEVGYWGVEQTSDRIVQFAVGLAGSSPEMLDKMEEAFEKGYAAAEKKWGGALPNITQQTRARVHEKFEELRKQQSQSSGAESDGNGLVLATVSVKAQTIGEETA